MDTVAAPPDVPAPPDDADRNANDALVLMARVETLKKLVEGLSARVAIVTPNLSVVYANRSARASSLGRLQNEGRSGTCHEAFARRSDPCEACPASSVFHALDLAHAASGIGGEGAACGLQRAFPLISDKGVVESLLLQFRDGEGESRTEEQTDLWGAHPLRGRCEPTETGLGEMIGRSPAMRQLFDLIGLVAESQATVLLQGESGTGKELVARTIHQLGARRDNAFVVVDCGSLPETLLESELFGHVKGAFTGAVSNKKGLFEEASGGTVFLDEIADTTPQFQAKLLRVLQEGEVKPVGCSRRIKVDVRVISATNRDLTELVKAKLFRQDLYYRLAVLPLHIPPLRERREDIPLLVEHFVEESCRRHGRPLRRVTSEALRALREAPWPGNVRELRHYLERMVVTTTGSELTCRHLGAPDPAPELQDLRTVARGALQQAERLRILEVLQQVGGNRAQAARLLKISRANLYNKLKAYAIGDR